MALSATTSTNWTAAVFSELLLIAASLRTAASIGNFEVFRERLVELFHQAEREGERVQVSKENLRTAKFAVCAFIDEMVFKSPWPGREEWSSKTLQYEFFNTEEAGVEFYRELNDLRRALPLNVDLLEVFYLCLTLGFEGQYSVAGREKRKALIGDIARDLLIKRGEVPSLSPHGARPDDFIVKARRDWLHWAVAFASAMIAIALYLILSVQATGMAKGVVDDLTVTAVRINQFRH